MSYNPEHNQHSKPPYLGSPLEDAAGWEGSRSQWQNGTVPRPTTTFPQYGAMKDDQSPPGTPLSRSSGWSTPAEESPTGAPAAQAPPDYFHFAQSAPIVAPVALAAPALAVPHQTAHQPATAQSAVQPVRHMASQPASQAGFPVPPPPPPPVGTIPSFQPPSSNSKLAAHTTPRSAAQPASQPAFPVPPPPAPPIAPIPSFQPPSSDSKLSSQTAPRSTTQTAAAYTVPRSVPQPASQPPFPVPPPPAPQAAPIPIFQPVAYSDTKSAAYTAAPHSDFRSAAQSTAFSDSKSTAQPTPYSDSKPAVQPVPQSGLHVAHHQSENKSANQAESQQKLESHSEYKTEPLPELLVTSSPAIFAAAAASAKENVKVEQFTRQIEVEPAARHEVAKKRHRKRKWFFWCCGISVIALIAILVPLFIYVIKKTPKEVSLYNDLIACNSEAPYQVVMRSQPKDRSLTKAEKALVKRETIRDKSKLFDPYDGQCNHNLSSSYFVPDVVTPLSSQSVKAPFEIMIPRSFEVGDIYDFTALKNLKLLADRKQAEIQVYPIPRPLVPYLLDESSDVGGELTCLQRPLQIITLKEVFGELNGDNPALYDVSAFRLKDGKLASWEDIRKEVQLYQKDAVEIYPGDGYDWEWNLDRKNHGGAENFKRHGYSCWISFIYNNVTWYLAEDGSVKPVVLKKED
ncbi:hypothetical protein BJ508DRAFT_155922 [Ascobolus immersus RN42]|uniref:Uncharacterized protein n=1 Tax=Ascobolus immersus RN42 TaxID=1160509 RepID=A0A3N4HXB7_ASCIM|nr:hypothetical protein BJ508DRAFT_155922 [Ascobolus immersus RN42]